MVIDTQSDLAHARQMIEMFIRPQPYVCMIVSGEGEVVTSDSEARRFHPGEVLFCDDLTGKGHVTRAVTYLTPAFINRAKS